LFPRFIYDQYICTQEREGENRTEKDKLFDESLSSHTVRYDIRICMFYR